MTIATMAGMRRVLSDLTYADGTYGGGPLVIAALCGWQAIRADEPTHRWAWVATAAVMLIICAIYLVWTVRRAARHLDATANDD